MNPLEELHNKIDTHDWNVKENHMLNEEFLKTNKKLEEAGELGLLRKSEIERWVFALNKTAERGLIYKVAGTQKQENGEEKEFVWPDINEFNGEDFKHIEARFLSTKNLYAKTEYGLTLYYAKRLQHTEVLSLLESLYALAKDYYEKSLPNDDKNHYIIYFRIVLGNAFRIAVERAGDGKIKNLLDELVKFSTEVHNSWNISHKSTLRSVIDLTDFAIDYLKYFKDLVSLDKYLDQNYAAALEVAKSYNWGAIYICDISQKLAVAIDNTKYDWQTLKAEQYEAMIQPAVEIGNMAAVSFIESALSIYKQIKNSTKVQELSKKYQEVRKIFRMGQVRQDLPEGESKRIAEIIEKEVATKSERELVEILCLTPMFAPLESVKKNAEEIFGKMAFASLFPSSIIDKYGNTAEVYIDEEEKKKFQFWESYELSFQIGSQTLVHFFIDAIKAGKINYNATIDFLSSTWIGETYTELYGGHEHKICPLDVLKPGLRLFFEELEKWKEDNKTPLNFVCATDSLVTKSEYIIRFFCKLAGIPTFVDKVKGSHKLKMEKNIDELLKSLEDREDNPTGFFEEHRVYIQYILSQKAGMNLRNRIAHGLMDAYEYDVVQPLLLLTIFLKLSSYNIK